MFDQPSPSVRRPRRPRRSRHTHAALASNEPICVCFGRMCRVMAPTGPRNHHCKQTLQCILIVATCMM